jgi:hypothetical protein
MKNKMGIFIFGIQKYKQGQWIKFVHCLATSIDIINQKFIFSIIVKHDLFFEMIV